MITIPDNVQLIDWPTSTMWFDEDGVLFAVPKTGVPIPKLSRAEQEVEMEKFRALLGNEKRCMILETNANSPPPNKEERDYAAKQLDSVVKAMGIISTSPLSRMIANLFFGLKPPAYPVKFFSNEKDAKQWIMQYL